MLPKKAAKSKYCLAHSFFQSPQSNIIGSISGKIEQKNIKLLGKK